MTDKINIANVPMNVTFKSAVLKGEEAKTARTPEFQKEHGIFGIHELEIGGEDFVAVFGRTSTTLKPGQE